MRKSPIFTHPLAMHLSTIVRPPESLRVREAPYLSINSMHPCVISSEKFRESYSPILDSQGELQHLHWHFEDLDQLLKL